MHYLSTSKRREGRRKERKKTGKLAFIEINTLFLYPNLVSTKKLSSASEVALHWNTPKQNLELIFLIIFIQLLWHTIKFWLAAVTKQKITRHLFIYVFKKLKKKKKSCLKRARLTAFIFGQKNLSVICLLWRSMKY